MVESSFQNKLIRELKRQFPNLLILKNDPSYMQGVPDLILLYDDKWVMLEVKRTADAAQQPNQEYYINLLNSMSYASFVYPENKNEVLDEIQRIFWSGRNSRLSVT